MSRFLSVRIEVEVDPDDDDHLAELGRLFAARARRAIEQHPSVVDIQHASYVTRRR